MSSIDPQAQPAQPIVRENILGSRKTAAMVIGSLCILADVFMVSKMQTPSDIATTSLYMISGVVLSVVTGQSVVDSLAKWRSGPAPDATK